MTKLILIGLLGITMSASAGYITVTNEGYIERWSDPNNPPPIKPTPVYARDPRITNGLCLAEVLIEADAIITGIPKFADYAGTPEFNLLELTDVHFIVANEQVSSTSTGRLFYVDKLGKNWDAPDVLTHKKSLLFLTRSVNDKAIRDKYKLSPSDKLFEPCEYSNAAILLDLSFPPGDKKLLNLFSPNRTELSDKTRTILKRDHGIIDPEELVAIVHKLTCWREKGKAKEEQIHELLSLLNSGEHKFLYEINIPQILLYLGVKVEKQGDKYIVKGKLKTR